MCLAETSKSRNHIITTTRNHHFDFRFQFLCFYYSTFDLENQFVFGDLSDVAVFCSVVCDNSSSYPIARHPRLSLQRNSLTCTAFLTLTSHCNTRHPKDLQSSQVFATDLHTITALRGGACARTMDAKLNKILCSPDFEEWRASLWKEISTEAIHHGWVAKEDIRPYDRVINPDSARWSQLYARLVGRVSMAAVRQS